MTEDVIKGIIGIISAVIIFSALIPILNELSGQLQTPMLNIFNILIPLFILLIILRFLKEVFNL